MRLLEEDQFKEGYESMRESNEDEIVLHSNNSEEIRPEEIMFEEISQFLKRPQ